MTARHPAITCRPARLLTLLPVLLLTGCDPAPPSTDHGEQDEESYFTTPPETVEAVHRNNLRHEPTDFLRSRSADPIHWQGWSRDVFAAAEREQRLVFAVVGSAEFPQTVELLDILRKRSDLAEELNTSYVCALADVRAHPELAVHLTDLCGEINRPISFPMLAWFSHEGNPVAWLPLTGRDIDSFDEVFGTSGVMVSRIWRDSPRYVIVNSARDGEARMERNRLEDREEVDLATFRETLHGASRGLAALFDPATGGVDGGGGLVPSGLLQFSSQAGLSGQIPEATARTLRTMTASVSRTLLSSAVCDPLDGGFFSGRRSRGWEIPNALKTADTQSFMAVPLAQAATSLDEPGFLTGARRCLDYNSQAFAEGPGSISSYTVVTGDDAADRAFFWSQEKVRELLPEDEYEVAQAVFNLSGLGNIPFESDPRRDFFRKNTLGRSRSVEEVAVDTGRSAAEVANLLASASKRLHAYRQELLTRSDEIFTERCRTTSTNANYAAALAQLARATGEPEHHRRALEVRSAIKAGHHDDKGGLLRFARTEGRRDIAARGEDYAALLDALFALYRNDLDPAHLADILALTQEALAALTDENGHVEELPVTERVLPVPIYSTRMIFGPSTWGRLYGPLERLNQLTDDEGVAATAARIRAQLRADAGGQPMIHTDFLSSSLIPLTDTLVVLQGTPGAAGFDALHAVLQRPAHEPVTIVHASDGLPEAIRIPANPAPGATVIRGPDQLGTASSPEELERLLSGAAN